MFIKTWREDVVWFNNFLPGLDGLNIEDLTWVEINARKRMLITYSFFKTECSRLRKCVHIGYRVTGWSSCYKEIDWQVRYNRR